MTTLDAPVSTVINVKMETDKAIIAANIRVYQGDDLVKILDEAVIPKMSMFITDQHEDITYAQIEHWVLKQRIEESRATATPEMVNELVSLAQEIAEPF